jgi:hypothetical protein
MQSRWYLYLGGFRKVTIPFIIVLYDLQHELTYLFAIIDFNGWLFYPKNFFVSLQMHMFFHPKSIRI